jgi:hypothetical protein
VIIQAGAVTVPVRLGHSYGWATCLGPLFVKPAAGPVAQCPSTTGEGGRESSLGGPQPGG